MKFYKKAVELFDNAFLTDIVKKTNVLRFNYSNDYESGNAFVRLKSIPQHYRKKTFHQLLQSKYSAKSTATTTNETSENLFRTGGNNSRS
jgi:hypothetical protein